MKLHEYQQRAIAHIRRNDRCVLSIGCGLGKTASVLHYLDAAKPSSVIIVAPKRVAEYTWLQEAEKWSLPIASKMVVVKGDKKKRLAALADTDRPYKVVSRDNLNDILDESGHVRMVFSCVVIDELTSFKNVASKRTKVMSTIATYAFNVIGMTGTFLANGAIDIFGQLAACGICNIKGFYSWRGRYFRDVMAGSGLPFHKWRLMVPLEEVLQPVRERIFTLSSDDYLDIPDVTIREHIVTLSKEEKTNYDRLEAFLGCDLDGVGISADENTKFMKLQTLCDGFVYEGSDDEAGDDGYFRHVVRGERSTKMEAVADLCEHYVNENEPVLLFYAFIAERQWLTELLKARGIDVMDIRDKGAIDTWCSGDFVGVMTAHPASAGHGLNLQGGGRVLVWSSVTYNYEYYIQANARLARQGQNKAVQVHIFTASGTIEEKKMKALEKKDEEQNEFIKLTKM